MRANIGLLLLLLCLSLSGALGQRASWTLPENALFFLPDATQRWDAIPGEAHEWLLLDRLSRKLFMVLPPADTAILAQRGEVQTITPGSQEETAIREQALKEWGRILAPAWLPAASMVTAAGMVREKQRHKIAYCALSRPEANIIIMGVLGQQYQVYVEQPDPLPEGLQPITPAELLAPTSSRTTPDDAYSAATPQCALTTTTVTRYRALLPTGLYMRVRILLISARLSEALSLRSVGY